MVIEPNNDDTVITQDGSVDHERSMGWNIIVVFLIILAVLGPLSVHRYYSSYKQNTVVGVVVRINERYVFLRLTTDDVTNGFQAGEIYAYTVPYEKLEEIELGNLVKGVPVKAEGNPLLIKQISQFLEPPLIVSGDYIILEDVSLNRGPSSRYPCLFISVYNLGEKKIVAMRAVINGTILPFSFRINRNNPVVPNEWGSDAVSTRWFDPDQNKTVGFMPVVGETYPVFIKVKLLDGSVKTWNTTVKTESYGVIATIGFFEAISVRACDLFRLGPGGGGALSISFRNTWYHNNTINKITVFLDDKQVMEAPANIPVADYWVGSIDLSERVYAGFEYEVTIQVRSTSGNTTSIKRTVICEYL